MKRYQIHLAQTVETEIIVEAESEQIARNYALNVAHDKLPWSPAQPPKVTHLDVLDGNPEE